MKNNKYCIDDFKLLSVFSYGNYSKVALVRKKENMQIYAMKVIKKKGKAKGIKEDHALVEKDILMKSSHPFIIKMHTTFQDKNRLFFILDYCPGGELFGLLRRNRRFNQQACRFYAAQILLALEYLHEHKIIYRDLKPQNIVLDKDGYIRIVDFGLSLYHYTSSELSERDLAGTVYYLAPESFDKKQNIQYASDWWSYGCLLFQLIMGFPPFYSHQENIRKLIQKIKTQRAPLEYISSQILRDFLQKLLEKNPSKRLGFKNAEQVKKHPWMMGVDWQRISRKTIVAPFVPTLTCDQDITWFQQECQNMQLSPPVTDQIFCEQYKQFSVSWQSSSERSPNQTSPIEIIVEQSVQLNGIEQQVLSNFELQTSAENNLLPIGNDKNKHKETKQQL